MLSQLTMSPLARHGIKRNALARCIEGGNAVLLCVYVVGIGNTDAMCH